MRAIALNNSPRRLGAGCPTTLGRVVCSLIPIAFLAGCASVDIKDRAQEVVEAGYAYTNIIGKSSSGSELVFASFGKIRGDLTPGSGPNYFEHARFVAPWGSLTILLPRDANDEQKIEYLTESIDTRFSSSAITVIGSSIEKLPSVRQYEVHLRILFAPDYSGYFIREETSTGGSSLSFSFIALVSPESLGLGTQGPWVNAVRNVAHELFHVEHFLSGSEADVGSANGEAAAEMMAWCAHSQYLSDVGLSAYREEMRIGSDEQVETAFPGLKNGIFEPAKNLSKISIDDAFLGSFLARAIVFSRAQEGTIALGSPETQAFLFERCTGLDREFPDYLDGEW